MTNSDQILFQLGERIGIELFFDANDFCFLALDESLYLSIKRSACEWMFIGRLMNDISHKESEFWKKILAMNLDLAKQQNGLICYDESNDCLLYLNSLPTSQLNPDLVYNTLESHFSQLELITQQLN